MNINYVFYKNTNLTAMMRGYDPADEVIFGWAGEVAVEPGPDFLNEALEDVFVIHNYDERPSGQSVPSCSVGDVVKLLIPGEGEFFYACDKSGWTALSQPVTIIAKSWDDVMKEMMI